MITCLGKNSSQCGKAGVDLAVADDGDHLFLSPADRLRDEIIVKLKQLKTPLLLWLKMEPDKWKIIHHEGSQIEFFHSGDGDSGDISSLNLEENRFMSPSPPGNKRKSTDQLSRRKGDC